MKSKRPWFLKIQNDGGQGKWRNSQIRKKGGRGKFILHSEDWTDNDFNDLIVKVKKIQNANPIPPEPPPPEQPGPPDPNIKLKGTGKLESDVDFNLTREDVEAGKTSKTTHQKINDGELKRIVGCLRSGEITLDTFEIDEQTATKSEPVSVNTLVKESREEHCESPQRNGRRRMCTALNPLS